MGLSSGVNLTSARCVWFQISFVFKHRLLPNRILTIKQTDSDYTGGPLPPICSETGSARGPLAFTDCFSIYRSFLFLLSGVGSGGTEAPNTEAPVSWVSSGEDLSDLLCYLTAGHLPLRRVTGETAERK